MYDGDVGGHRADPLKIDPRETKAELRARLLATRNERHGEQAARASGTLPQSNTESVFTDRLIELVGGSVEAGTVIATYQPLSSEPNVSGFNDYLLAKGAVVLIPDLSVPPTGATLPFRLAEGTALPDDVDDIDSLIQTDGIRAMIVPALALDQAGTRLGRGGGWYDMALRRFTSGDCECPARPALIGIAFEDEFSAGAPLPVEEHDQRMDYIVTEDRTLKVTE